MAISDRNMELMLIIALLSATYIMQASSVVPQAFPATRVGGSDQGCPTEEEWAAARNEVLQEVYAQIVEQFGVTPSPLPGERSDFPASSCQQIAELSPDSPLGNYWIIAPNGSAVLVNCNMNAIGQTEVFPASSCQQIAVLDPSRPSGFNWVRSSNGTAVRVYCDMTRECCGTTGGWTRVAFLDMTDPSHQCPPAWREITRSEEPRRTCGRTNETGPPLGGGCSSAVYSSNGAEYGHVCGRILGYQYGSPNAFDSYNIDNSATIDTYYLDGVSVTHGNPRQHVWSFATPYYEQQTGQYTCPCSNTANTATIAIPLYVGQDYFCETGANIRRGGIFYADDPLWDGENCGPTSTCCEFNNPPWFCKQLPEPTTDDIEVRICANQPTSNEDTPTELIEIYVQ